MDINNNPVFSQAEQLYHIKPLHEITMGGSSNSIFEVSSGHFHIY